MKRRGALGSMETWPAAGIGGAVSRLSSSHTAESTSTVNI